VKAEITREFTFEAAHHLPPVGPDHKCFRLHGHLFKVEVSVAGEIDPEMGWVMDFGQLAHIGGKVMSELDHRVLNDIDGLDVPTSENIARYLFEKIGTQVDGLVAVTVHESPYSRCEYRPLAAERDTGCGVSVSVGEGAGILLSSAHFLLFPPDGREPIHGHDYRLSATMYVPSRDMNGLEEVIDESLRKAVEDLDHKLLIPARPVVGELSSDDVSIDLVLPGETIHLPAKDCAVVDLGNTSTEALTQLVAGRVASMESIRSIGAIRIDVRMTESVTSSSEVSIDVAPMRTPES